MKKGNGIKRSIEKRFLKYVKFDTKSDSSSKTFPSSVGQKRFAEYLVSELKKIGAKVERDKHYYVVGEIPPNVRKSKTIGFLAHMDTSPDFSGKGVKPVVHRNYSGGTIWISRNKNISISPENCPPLSSRRGEDIITASGDTLLGADDKAGIAIIMTFAEYLLKNPDIPRPRIKIAFTPDEEIGKGIDFFDVKKFGADFAYTLDGDVEGTVEDETFNADLLRIKICGKSVHPGTAKNSLANASRIAADIAASWPENMLPETTEGREGFIMFTSIKTSIEEGKMEAIVREHDFVKFEKLKKHIVAIINEKRLKYPLAKIEYSFKTQYRNMRCVIDKNPVVMKKLFVALEKAGIKAVLKPVRGGTDGARLSYMGLPCPNIFTGGYNYHGPYEWVSLDGMEKAFNVVLNLAVEWTR